MNRTYMLIAGVALIMAVALGMSGAFKTEKMPTPTAQTDKGSMVPHGGNEKPVTEGVAK